MSGVETSLPKDFNGLSHDYQSLKMVKSSGGYGLLSFVSFSMLTLLVFALVLVPWQQSISGLGKVIIFSPMERPQNIEAQIPARIMNWHVRDGQHVKTGQLIAELTDLDSKFLDPSQSLRLKKQIKALDSRRQAARTRAEALGMQLESLKRSQFVALPSAKVRTDQTKDRIRAAEQSLTAAKQNTVTTQLNLERLKELFQKGLRSKRDLELSELDHTRALTETERALAALEVARRDQTVACYDQEKIAADTDAAIANVSSVIAQAQETIESTTSEILKIEVELQNVEQRFKQRMVVAPSSGRIVRLNKVGTGETVDAGTVLAVIAPETQDLAAELLISDNDAPLVSVGRPVRLQFAGWPALQFSGWPSIAVGTFAGKVEVIDAVDNGQNSYRVIVKPDLELIASGRDEPWPSSQFLRPGAEVSGWIMLDNVPLGFELWRQFNAFPPTVKPEALGLHKSADIGSSEKKRKSK